MTPSLVPFSGRKLTRAGFAALPPIIERAGSKASRRFLEFFLASIRNKNTRLAYARAVRDFLAWCDERGIHELERIDSFIVAAYIEQLGGKRSAPTVKQHLAAIRMLFDYLVTGGVEAMPFNPAAAVRGPSYVVKKGKTPVLKPEEARLVLDSIDTGTLVGLRDRALIGVMVYSFARVGAVVSMDVRDYYQQGKRWWLRLHEKGGKRHEVPAHHNAEAYLDAYLYAANLWEQKKTPLFRSIDQRRRLTDKPMSRVDVFRMIKRRCRKAGISTTTNCHTWRATGITAYLLNGGTIENAQAIAAHESPRTTKLYNRTSDEITLDEVERIVI